MPRLKQQVQAPVLCCGSGRHVAWAQYSRVLFSLQAIEWFDLKGCSKSAACFDFAKLDSINAHYIRECDPERLLSLVRESLTSVAGFGSVAVFLYHA